MSDIATHTLASCPCDHPPDDHDSTTGKIVCRKCDHAAYLETLSEDQLANYARTFAEQAHQFVSQLNVDVSRAPTVSETPEAFAANAYERIAAAEKQSDRAIWDNAPNIDGQTPKEIMDHLWDVCQEFRRRKRDVVYN